MAHFPYVTFASVVSFNDVMIPAFCFCLSLNLYLNSLVYHRNIFGSSSKVFGNLRQSSTIIGNLRKMFGNVRLAFRTILENLRKSSEGGQKSSENQQRRRQIFSLPHLVALESYVKAFQYKVINSILYTNSKLCKIGFRINDACTFCNDEPENLYHFFCECPHSKTFWTDFESYWCQLSNQPIHLSVENVLFGILSKQCPLSNLLNYFIVIGKLFLWDCRRSQTLPKIQGLQSNLRLNMKRKKYQQ